MATKNNNSSIKKAKLIITIVDRNKTEFYTDVLSGFEINMQMVLYGNGTANSSTLELLGLNNEKGIILADNILYKGYVMSDYNKHKQRTAVRNLREYIKEVTENPNIETEILEVGDGLAVSRIK